MEEQEHILCKSRVQSAPWPWNSIKLQLHADYFPSSLSQTRKQQ